MSKQKVYDYCRVCGHYGEMSGEHVPPQAAFNNRRYVELTFEETLRLGPEDAPEGPIRQGGVTFNTLCGLCNNKGGRYARAFVEWCYQGMDILQRSCGHPKLIYAHDIFPLRVIKELLIMFLAVNSREFRQTPIGGELAWLVLNPEEKGLPRDVRFYAYFNIAGQFRYAPVSTLGNWREGSVHVFSEITYPPYGYVMSLGTKPPDPRLFDITHFAWCERGDRKTVYLDLPVLPTYFGTIPGDYRSLEAIYEQETRTRQEEAGIIPRPEPTATEQLKVMETMQKVVKLQDHYRGT